MASFIGILMYRAMVSLDIVLVIFSLEGAGEMLFHHR
jgi:hypothetical protein